MRRVGSTAHSCVLFHLAVAAALQIQRLHSILHARSNARCTLRLLNSLQRRSSHRALHPETLEDGGLRLPQPIHLLTAMPLISKWAPRTSGPDPTNARAG